MSRSHYHLNHSQSHPFFNATKLLSVTSSTYGEDWNSEPHTHSYTELFYIVGGKGHFLIDNQLYPVETNNLVVINPQVAHTELSKATQPLAYIVLGVESVELACNETTNGKFCILNCFESMEVSSCFRNILRETELQNSGYEEICQAYLEILIIRLMRSIELAVFPEPVLNNTNQQCAAAKRYIDLHFKEAISLDLVAEKSHMNKYYLAHAFKREYGVSPMSYLTSRRIDESKYLLAETDLSLSQISQLLGFSSPSYFTQVFRRTQSISPLEYRQATRQV